MNFDHNNPVIKLCADGMMLEGEGKPEQASALFQQAWELASDDFEKFTAAHYVARHQNNIADKLKWDEIALNHALKIPGNDIKGTLPSLYLNIAKGYEDLSDFGKARENYHLAMGFTDFLLDDGYGNMIRAGIAKGIERVQGK